MPLLLLVCEIAAMQAATVVGSVLARGRPRPLRFFSGTEEHIHGLRARTNGVVITRVVAANETAAFAGRDRSSGFSRRAVVGIVRNADVNAATMAGTGVRNIVGCVVRDWRVLGLGVLSDHLVVRRFQVAAAVFALFVICGQVDRVDLGVASDSDSCCVSVGVFCEHQRLNRVSMNNNDDVANLRRQFDVVVS